MSLIVCTLMTVNVTSIGAVVKTDMDGNVYPVGVEDTKGMNDMVGSENTSNEVTNNVEAESDEIGDEVEKTEKVAEEKRTKEIEVMLNNGLLAFSEESKPIMNGDRVMVPVKYVGDALGAMTEIDTITGVLTCRIGTDKIEFKLGGTKYTLNGKVSEMEVPPLVYNNNIYLPIRYAFEIFNRDVNWNAYNKAIIVDAESNLIEEYTNYAYEVKGKMDGELVFRSNYESGLAVMPADAYRGVRGNNIIEFCIDTEEDINAQLDDINKILSNLNCSIVREEDGYNIYEGKNISSLREEKEIETENNETDVKEEENKDTVGLEEGIEDTDTKDAKNEEAENKEVERERVVEERELSSTEISKILDAAGEGDKVNTDKDEKGDNKVEDKIGVSEIIVEEENNESTGKDEEEKIYKLNVKLEVRKVGKYEVVGISDNSLSINISRTGLGKIGYGEFTKNGETFIPLEDVCGIKSRTGNKIELENGKELCIKDGEKPEVYIADKILYINKKEADNIKRI